MHNLLLIKVKVHKELPKEETWDKLQKGFWCCCNNLSLHKICIEHDSFIFVSVVGTFVQHYCAITCITWLKNCKTCCKKKLQCRTTLNLTMPSWPHLNWGITNTCIYTHHKSANFAWYFLRKLQENIKQQNEYIINITFFCCFQIESILFIKNF